MQFALGHAAPQHSAARIGTLTLAKGAVRTPGFLYYTRVGAVPHLTPDMLRTLERGGDPLLLHVALGKFMADTGARGGDSPSKRSRKRRRVDQQEDAPPPVRKVISTFPAKFRARFASLAEYILAPQHCVFADLFDAHELSPAGDPLPALENTNRDLACLSRTGSVMRVGPQAIADAIALYRPDVFVCPLDHIFQAGEGKPENRVERQRRCTAFIARELQQMGKKAGWLAGSSKDDSSPTTSLLVSVGGGTDVATRVAFTREMAAALGDDARGIVFPFFDPSLSVETHLAPQLAAAPVHLPRVVYGLQDVQSVLAAIRNGADLFDGAFMHEMVQQGKAITFSEDGSSYTLLDMADPAFHGSLEPIDSGCACHACANKYTCAYVHHLVATHEMLAGVLLSCHNLRQFQLFFEKVRRKIEMGEALHVEERVAGREGANDN